MPNVFDYALSGGYLRRGLMANVSFRSSGRWAAATSGVRTRRSSRTA